MPRIVRVSGARDDSVNGMYRLLVATTRQVAKSSLPAGSVCVRDGGPDCRGGGDCLNDE